jgi:hypothetical protein
MAKNGNESTSKRSPRVTEHLESRMGTKFKVDDDPKRPKSLSNLVDELYHKHALTQKGGRFADMVDPKPSMKEKIRILLKGPLGALKEDVSPQLLDRLRREAGGRDEKVKDALKTRNKGGTDIKIKDIPADLMQQYRENFYDKGRDDTQSLTEYVTSGRAARDLKAGGKKKGGMKAGKKHIMDLPTNVPRLQAGAILGDLDKDGKLSGYEKVRQAAIEKNMAARKKNKSGRKA